MASCSEKGCVFPPTLSGLCRHHARMFEGCIPTSPEATPPVPPVPAALPNPPHTYPIHDRNPNGCPHPHLNQHGHDRNGNKRVQCVRCKRTFSLVRKDKFPLEYSYLPQGTIDTLVACYKAGLSHRESVRVCGVSSATIHRAYKRLREVLGVILCPCGKPASHRGWCHHRYLRSLKRQEFIREWTARRNPKSASSPTSTPTPL